MQLEFSPLQSPISITKYLLYCCEGLFWFVFYSFGMCYCYQNELNCMGMTNMTPIKSKKSSQPFDMSAESTLRK